MNTSIMINLPVKNVATASEFYVTLGFKLNEQFSNDQSAMITINDGAALMLVVEDFFKQNTGRDVADTETVGEVSLAIQVTNRAEVDKIIETGVDAGGKQVGETVEETEIGLYSRGLIDLDGHKLDFLCMTVQ